MSTNFLISFQEGDKIKASETNHNNQYLLDEIKTQVGQIDAYLKQELAKFERNLYAIGDIKASAADTTDEGWLECSGAELSREEYADLYAKIGTIFGEGNAVTTFNIPDLRGVVIRGFDNGRGLDTDRVFGSYQEDALQTHTHTYRTDNQNRPRGDDRTNCFTYDEMYETSPPNGCRVADETRMKNIALKYYIKVK